jgi:hypothetical protein
MASSVLLYIAPKDQIFDAPLSLRGPASSYRSAGLRRLSFKSKSGRVVIAPGTSRLD